MPPHNTPSGSDDFGAFVKAILTAITQAGAIPAAGMTPEEVAKRYRVSPDKVRGWIRTGKLRAVNTADAKIRRPRFVVLPSHLVEFERANSAAAPAKPPRRKRRTGEVDFFPD